VKQARNSNRRLEKRQAKKIIELSQEAGRMYTNTSSIYRMPLELAQNGDLKSGPCIARVARILGKYNPLSSPHAKGPVPNQKLGPIERRYVASKMLKKTIEMLSVAAFREARPHLIEGIRQSFEQFTSVSNIVVEHLMLLPRLTEATLERKFNHKHLFHPTDHNKGIEEGTAGAVITYYVSGAYLHNSKMSSGEYRERPMGGEFVFSKVAALKQHQKRMTDEAFIGNPDFPRDFATRSVLFPLDDDTAFVTDFLLAELNQALAEQEGGLNPQKHAALAADMLKTLNNISNEKLDTMQYTDPVMNSFHTSDYEVIFCQSRGEKEFKTQFHDYNILIYRKMAFALLKITASKEEPHMIPLFEEAMIYIQKKENSVLKNTANCLVLSSRPRGLDYLHVFGDNAFTCYFPPAIRSSSDRHQTSMKNAGIIIGLLDKVRNLRNGIDSEKLSLRNMFQTLMSSQGTTVRALHQKSVQNARQYAIDNAPEFMKNEIRHRHGENISEDELLSRSFLANQLKSKTITDQTNHDPRVSFWMASATFSIVIIQTKGKTMTYGFLQTYPFEQETAQGRQVVTNPKPIPVRAQSSGTLVFPATPRGSKRAADMQPGMGSPRGPSRPRSAGGNTDPSSGGGAMDVAQRGLVASQAAFHNSNPGGLPLELELELELL
jgi:hypothetical protein